MDLSSSDSYQKGKLTHERFMKLLYTETMKTSSKIFKIETMIKKIEKYFKTQDFKLINEFVEYEEIPIPIPEFNNNYPKLAEFVMNLPQKIYEEHNDEIKGTFIFIDEFQVVRELKNMDSFLWYIRSKVQSQKNVAYLFSGSMSIKDSLIENIAGKNGVFGGRMLTINIDPFSFETTKEYLKEKTENLNLPKEVMKDFINVQKEFHFILHLQD